MKKVLLTAAALGVAMALTASVAAAEMSFSAKGKYELNGTFVSVGNGILNPNDEIGVNLWDDETEGADAYWFHSFYLYPTLKVNDNITMNGQFRFIDRDVWGSGFDTSQDTMRVYQLWMDYASPVGKFSIGRMQGGTWGSKFLDSTRQRDGIKWATPFLSDPFSLTLLIEKSVESDGYIGGISDQDKDYYYVGLGHKGDMGKTDVALWHTRDANTSPTPDVVSNTQFWYNGVYTFGAINVTSELHYMFGDKNASTDYQSLGFMIDANTQLDAFTVGGMLIYMEGDDNVNDGDDSGAILSGGLGNDFNPLAIMTGDYMGLFNGDKAGVAGAVGGLSGMSPVMPGALVGAAYALFQANDKLGFSGVLALANANETLSGQDKSYGWEIDLGFNYKLLDNLTYTGTFGYMKTGDFWQFGNSDEALNNIYVLINTLTMTF
jgi:hypothetical protein